MTNKSSCALPGNHLSCLSYPKMRKKLGKFIFHKKKLKITVDLSFQQNLQAHHFVDAGKQLINREDRLFVLKQEGIGAKKKLLEEEEDSEAKLVKDYEDWWKLVMGTLENSLELNSAEEQDILKEAVQAILQEEEQDVQWERFKETERPPWRPRHCKQKHETLLETLVQSRMQDAPLDSSVETHSSVKNSILSKGKQLREDLLKVVTCVSSCYPEQDNVCQLYATLYHKSFSDELRKVANYGLCDSDCIVLLSWVNNHYHYILNDSRINEVIDCTQLNPLLPKDIIGPLEQQFLTSIENELSTWLHSALNREETAWKEGKIPELTDQKYSCPLHIDVIQCFDGSVRSAQEVLGDETKAQRVSCQMSNFLTDYKTFHDKVIKEKQTNFEAVLMANLWCITQFRDYIIKKAHQFPEDVKTNCLSLLNAMRDSSHAYFTSNFHKDLKELYKKLGSSKWLRDSEGICEELLAKVEVHLQKFKHLQERCCQELLSDLHKEFLAEYVRKMMKNKIRFADKEKQEKAAEAVCKNSDSIHTRLTAAGSNMDWLKDILPKLAGLLKLQHPDSIKLELCDLLRDYPDFSKRHVSVWLSLKTNLSASDLKQILNSVTFSQNQLKEEQELLRCSKSFFSFVRIK
ncbi:tumor necrosis factor alpha-induced protein 2 [Triplophysa rosa]|uniref:Tumor necrosis factor alpha-induced protein 2 n=1 Tax=Triplophysa rosa TaxID=992332 RepID=A0A9W7WPP8_TRIRA|nr:tumor necrosis factor alpha-induced protein 2 [Triplophysa rosa]KAI7806030.1 putative tumor necrosis factor alpha-induced protein 2 [Triplophysa rosa]